MRILALHPGASIATADVYAGFTKVLKAQGHTVYEYQLDKRIDRAGQWIMWNWRKSGKPDPRPNAADILYWAGLPSLEMALRLVPDYIVVFSGMYFLKHFLKLFKTMGAPVAIVLSESPYDLEQEREYAKLGTVIFTNERSSVAALREVNPNTHYLQHAYEPSLHYPGLPWNEPAHDVVFVGTMFRERVELLSAVDWTGIDLGLYGQTEGLGSRSKLRQFVRGRYLDNADTAKLYRNSRIGLNLYRTSKGFGRHAEHIDHAESLNPRAYELAACGTFQISDYRAEVDEVFGENVVTFTTPADLERKIRYYIAHKAEREALAIQASLLVVPHRFAARAEQLVEVLRHARREAA